MATTVWRGHLTFGLVSIPVRLFKAARGEKIRLHQMYKSKRVPASEVEPQSDSNDRASSRRLEAVPSPRTSATQMSPPATEEQYTRVRQNVYVPAEEPPSAGPSQDGTPVPRADLVKGYEFEKNRYVVLDTEDLRKVTPPTATEMEILEFVKLDEIDPVYFETSYYVAPDEAGKKAYALLFEAMRETKFVALAEVAMHRKEHVMVLRPAQHGLLAHTMFYVDEIRQNEEYRTDTSQVVARELQMAKRLVESLAAPFEPGKYKDKFREKLQAVLDAKVSDAQADGRQIAKGVEPRKSAAVVDILQALETSLKLIRKPAGKTEPVQSATTTRKTGQRGAGTRS